MIPIIVFSWRYFPKHTVSFLEIYHLTVLTLNYTSLYLPVVQATLLFSLTFKDCHLTSHVTLSKSSPFSLIVKLFLKTVQRPYSIDLQSQAGSTSDHFPFPWPSEIQVLNDELAGTSLKPLSQVIRRVAPSS